MTIDPWHAVLLAVTLAAVLVGFACWAARLRREGLRLDEWEDGLHARELMAQRREQVIGDAFIAAVDRDDRKGRR